MRALLKFVGLSNADRILIIRSAAVLAGIWIGLRIFPFGRVLEAVDTFSSVSRLKNNSLWLQDKIVWAVLAISRYSPLTPSCLEQALAAKITLGREGYPAVVRIGVAPGKGGQLRAHAWLESNGEIIIGYKGAEDFCPLPCFDRGQN